METKVDVKLTEDEIREFTRAAILEKLTPEKRDQLLRDAIGAVLKDRATYDKKTELERVFQATIARETEKLVQEELASGPYMNKIRAVFREAMAAAFDAHLDNLRSTLATNIANLVFPTGKKSDY